MLQRSLKAILFGCALFAGLSSAVLFGPAAHAQSRPGISPSLLAVSTSMRASHKSSWSAPDWGAVPLTTVPTNTLAAGPKCSGKHCTDQDPYESGCAGQSFDSWEVLRSAPLVNSKGQSSGYLQLWWSATCQTNWSRIVPGAAYTAASVSLSSNPIVEDERSLLPPNAPTQPANASIHTEQEYAPNLQVCAVGSFQAPSGSNFSATIKQSGARC